MTAPTIWPARVGRPSASGSRGLLCGRTVDGRATCSGDIGWLARRGTAWQVYAPVGFVLGADDVYRPSSATRRAVARHPSRASWAARHPIPWLELRFPRYRRPRPPSVYQESLPGESLLDDLAKESRSVAMLPYRAECLECRAISEVLSELFDVI